MDSHTNRMLCAGERGYLCRTHRAHIVTWKRDGEAEYKAVSGLILFAHLFPFIQLMGAPLIQRCYPVAAGLSKNKYAIYVLNFAGIQKYPI